MQNNNNNNDCKITYGTQVIRMDKLQLVQDLDKMALTSERFILAYSSKVAMDLDIEWWIARRDAS